MRCGVIRAAAFNKLVGSTYLGAMGDMRGIRGVQGHAHLDSPHRDVRIDGGSRAVRRTVVLEERAAPDAHFAAVDKQGTAALTCNIGREDGVIDNHRATTDTHCGATGCSIVEQEAPAHVEGTGADFNAATAVAFEPHVNDDHRTSGNDECAIRKALTQAAPSACAYMHLRPTAVGYLQRAGSDHHLASECDADKAQWWRARSNREQRPTRIAGR